MVKDEEKTVIVIHISSITGVPVSVRGRYFRRIGRTNQRMSHEEIMQRMVTSTGLSWDAIIESTATLADLDVDQISRFVHTLKKKGRLPIPAQATDQEVLRKLELIKNEMPTRAALLLFGSHPGIMAGLLMLSIKR
jgi:ATP-dependent DNA helicase RecG